MLAQRLALLVGFVITATGHAMAQDAEAYQYRLLATNRTSTMEKEMNEAARAGFRFAAVMGGGTAFGGSETVLAMFRQPMSQPGIYCEYKLLATSRTSTMEKELKRAGDAGFQYKGQTVFKTTFGGNEVVVILERDPATRGNTYEYKLLATSRTSTMEKELSEAGRAGFALLGLTVGETAFGGKELVTILARPVRR